MGEGIEVGSGNRPGLTKKSLGDRGEALVAAWLRQTGWTLIARQWHCRWGELDIVAYHPAPQLCIAFVEVKTRRHGGLDGGGRLAITAQKQRKLWRSAEKFLHQYPHYAEHPCRFDVALVAWNAPTKQPALLRQSFPEPPVSLALVEYIPDAFQLS